MAELPRLNGIIKALEEGSVAFVGSAPADGAAGTSAPYDGALFEMEHGPYDIRALQEGLQSMLDRRQIAQGGLAPAVTPSSGFPRTRARPTGSPNRCSTSVCTGSSGLMSIRSTRRITPW